jgi:hypothetical protein
MSEEGGSWNCWEILLWKELIGVIWGGVAVPEGGIGGGETVFCRSLLGGFQPCIAIRSDGDRLRHSRKLTFCFPTR